MTYQEVSRFFADDQRIVLFLCDIDQLCLRDNKTEERIVRRVCCADSYQNIVSYRQKGLIKYYIIFLSFFLCCSVALLLA